MKHLVACVVIAVLGGCQATESRPGSSQLAMDGSLDRVWMPSDEGLLAPIWMGDDDKGTLVMPMFRGTAVAIEDYRFVVMVPPFSLTTFVIPMP